jgi:hypothetical protein
LGTHEADASAKASSAQKVVSGRAMGFPEEKDAA